EIVQRAAREGHEIGNHSWSHPNLAKMSDDAVRSQIKRTEDAITGAIGSRPVLLRPPYGSITTRQKHFIHDELGYEIILWDVDPLDWKEPGPSIVSSRILKETRPGSLEMLHALLIDIRQPLLFVVVGEVKAGKSSLLNALFGHEFAKTGVLPATDRVCIFRYGEVEKTVDVSPQLIERYLPIDFLRD